MLLTKGLEEEVYTGTRDGEVVGMSHRVAADLPGFATEPDSRNVEFTTAPYRSYEILVDRLMTKRCRLRNYLKDQGDYTLIPGSTLSLAGSEDFQISNPQNPYYQHIRDLYGTKVVTASTHVNIGIDDAEELLRAYRVVRTEASIFLALSACSPFLHGEIPGGHSMRWLVFPETPRGAPFFRNQRQFVDWVEAQLRSKVMFNPRHLWLSIRPNGMDTPYGITRLELRICDRLTRPRILAAVVALLEARVWQVLEDPALDPLLHRDEQWLIETCARNEQAAARASLESRLVDWRSGAERDAVEWIREIAESAREAATAHGFERWLEPIEEILAEGNLAQQWLREIGRGKTIREVIVGAIEELNRIDAEYHPDCPSPVEFMPVG
ncbi:MAG: glutamate--cysteine ligase [Acidobacteria bacterium]|nr:MAG: glutamate--cysteine ligase [Acidobacteriota bacterium]